MTKSSESYSMAIHFSFSSFYSAHSIIGFHSYPVPSSLLFSQDESLMSFIRGGLRIRQCYSTYKWVWFDNILQCYAFVHRGFHQWIVNCRAGGVEVEPNFAAGVSMGIGLFNMVSIWVYCPVRVCMAGWSHRFVYVYVCGQKRAVWGLKLGSQYYAHASVVSQASGWCWNRLDFYSSVASWALTSVQPIWLSKNLLSGMQFDWWKKKLFPLMLTMLVTLAVPASYCEPSLTAWRSFIGVTYCSLVKFNGQKRGLLHQVIHSWKEIWKHSINGTEEFWKIVLQ